MIVLVFDHCALDHCDDPDIQCLGCPVRGGIQDCPNAAFMQYDMPPDAFARLVQPDTKTIQ